MSETETTAGARARSNSAKPRKFGIDHASGKLVMGSVHVPMPKSRIARISIGVALTLGGFLGFLPILGFWMVPLGIVVLSQDIAIARRIRRRVSVSWARWRQSRKNASS